MTAIFVCVGFTGNVAEMLINDQVITEMSELNILTDVEVSEQL